MLAQIILFILDTVCGFLTLTLLVRFAMQWAGNSLSPSPTGWCARCGN